MLGYRDVAAECCQIKSLWRLKFAGCALTVAAAYNALTLDTWQAVLGVPSSAGIGVISAGSWSGTTGSLVEDDTTGTHSI